MIGFILYAIGVFLAYLPLKNLNWKFRIGCLLSWILVASLIIQMNYEGYFDNEEQ